MLTNFQTDLAFGKKAEAIVKEHLEKCNPTCIVEDVSCKREYFHKGDIKVTAADGREEFFEVKNDRCIGKTKNILCEEKVYYFGNGAEKEGFMYSDYTNFVIVSEPERKLYLIDFDILKNIYKQGEYRYMSYQEQASDVYLLPLDVLKKNGGLLKVANY